MSIIGIDPESGYLLGIRLGESKRFDLYREEGDGSLRLVGKIDLSYDGDKLVVRRTMFDEHPMKLRFNA